MILYIHGFLSSPLSSKAQELKKWLEQQGKADTFICPQLSANPTLAIEQLIAIINNTKEPLILVGSSLGGFYATYLSQKFNLKAVLINPAVNPDEVLANKVGVHKAWHSEDNIVFSADDLNNLKNFYTKIESPNNILLMIEKDDEVLDYQKALHYYKDCNQLIFNNGDHSFTRFKEVISLIDYF